MLRPFIVKVFELGYFPLHLKGMNYTNMNIYIYVYMMGYIYPNVEIVILIYLMVNN